MKTNKIIYLYGFLISILTYVASGSEFESLPMVELGDVNFEHDTQAAMGQTTGRWLVLFSDSSHPASTDTEGSFQEASASEGRGVLFAKVDVGTNPKLRKRFDVNAGPKLILFRDRKMYLCGSGCGSEADIVTFVEGGYRSADVSIVPPEPSPLDYLQKWAAEEYARVVEYLMARPVVLAFLGGSVAMASYAITARVLGLREVSKKAQFVSRKRSHPKNE